MDSEVVERIAITTTFYIRNNGDDYSCPYDWYSENGDESDGLFETKEDAIADVRRRFA